MSKSLSRRSLLIFSSLLLAACGSGNDTTPPEDVVVKDSTPPVITLIGDADMVIDQASTFSDPGVNVSDDTDSNLIAAVTGSVDTSQVGSYNLIYNVSDSAGNAANPITRTVTVRDIIAPVITLNGKTTLTVEMGTLFTDPGCSVSDNVESGLIATTTGTVDTTKVGSYIINYDVVDTAGNIAETQTLTVTVTDILSGKFVGSPISGLSYSTDSQSGMTDESGGYKFKAGETISFSLGDISIGDGIAAQKELTVLELINGAQLYTNYGQVKKLYEAPVTSVEKKTLNRFSNTLTLLLAFDQDGNWANGISIHPELANSLAFSQLDLSEDLYDFSDNSELKAIAHSAVALSLLNKVATPKLGIALDHYYQTQEIAHQFAVLYSESVDDNADGVDERSQTYTYDSQGNKLTESSDDNNDGIVDSRYHYTYNEQSDQLTSSSDSNADGVMNRISTTTYDNNGNAVSSTTDTDGDGQADSSSQDIYDETGKVVIHNYDSDANDIIDSVTSYTYSTKHELLTDSYDGDVDGIADRIYINSYDVDGNRIENSYDSNGDGLRESFYTYTYDAQGNQLTNFSDSNADDIPDRKITYTFDTDGNQLSYSFDNDADGTPETFTVSTYDTDGNKLSYRSDTTGDGLVNKTASYTYNAFSQKITYSQDSDADSIPDRINVYSYDVNGNYQSTTIDSDANGTVDRIFSYTPVNANWRAVLLQIEMYQ